MFCWLTDQNQDHGYNYDQLCYFEKVIFDKFPNFVIFSFSGDIGDKKRLSHVMSDVVDMEE